MRKLCLERQWTREILREGNPYGQECVGILGRRLDLSWAGRTGMILIKRAGRGALPGGEQPVNKDVEWGAGVGCFRCMRFWSLTTLEREERCLESWTGGILEGWQFQFEVLKALKEASEMKKISWRPVRWYLSGLNCSGERWGVERWIRRGLWQSSCEMMGRQRRKMPLEMDRTHEGGRHSEEGMGLAAWWDTSAQKREPKVTATEPEAQGAVCNDGAVDRKTEAVLYTKILDHYIFLVEKF